MSSLYIDPLRGVLMAFVLLILLYSFFLEPSSYGQQQQSATKPQSTAHMEIDSAIKKQKEKVDKDSADALSRKKELENRLADNQSSQLYEKNFSKKEVLQYANDLTQNKIALLDLRLNTNANLEEKIDQFQNTSQLLKKLSQNIALNNEEKLIESFKDIEKVWLSLSKENYYSLFFENAAISLPELPKPLDETNIDTDLIEINNLREEILELRKEIIKNFADKKNQELKLLNNLVENSNSLRERYFKSLGLSYLLQSMLTSDFYYMTRNEIISAPYRMISYFYSKYIFMREQISLGKEGYVTLFVKLCVILLIFSSLYLLKLLFIKINRGIEKIFEYGFKKKRRNYMFRKSFNIWSRLRDSAPAFLWLFTLHLAKKYEVFNSVILLIEIAEVYLAANILKSFMTIFLGKISIIDTSNFFAFRKKANETSNKFKKIFSYYFYTMIFIEATVGQVYLYTILYYFVVIYSLYNFILESTKWETELSIYCEKNFSGLIVGRFFVVLDYCPKFLRPTFLLLFIILFLAVDIIIGMTENLEISKKISAKFFKKQIEKIEAEDGADNKIPKDYKDNFSLKSLTTDREHVKNYSDLEATICGEVNEWINDKSGEHSVVVFGDKGIGKTTLLKKIDSSLSENEQLSVLYTKMPPKTLSKSSIREFVANFLGHDASQEKFDLYHFDKNLEKNTVVIIDECQNVFLSQTGSFDAYYELINYLNINTEHIFWIMSFNKYSWLYLDRAFGRTQFFRKIFELSGWNDTQIKELIMRRHSQTNFKLSYDLLISATRSQDEIDKYASIELKFFKLLWELSRGNPRAALYLWMTALSRKSHNVLTVNIPKESSIEGMEHITDELMFVVAQVLKHENLSAHEIELTTNFQKGIVRNAIKIALERKFFFKDDRNRYMVDIATQYALVKTLRLKNFIYGNT